MIAPTQTFEPRSTVFEMIVSGVTATGVSPTFQKPVSLFCHAACELDGNARGSGGSVDLDQIGLKCPGRVPSKDSDPSADIRCIPGFADDHSLGGDRNLSVAIQFGADQPPVRTLRL